MLIKEKNLAQFDHSLQRIFSMKVSRSTFREVQNAVIACTEGDQESAKNLFEILLTGIPQRGDLDDVTFTRLQNLVERYTVPVRLSKDVTEKGEFVNLITSDTLRQGDLVAFLNRVRRIDGEEFQFITDVEATLQMLLHLVTRLEELKQTEAGASLLAKYQQHLNSIQQHTDTLTATAT